jgi:hypothetical protein
VLCAIHQALEYGAGEILYVGLRKNVEDDLGDRFPEFREIGFGAGKDEEVVWSLTPEKRKEQNA